MRLVTRATLVFFLLPALASAQQGPLLAVTGQKAPVVAPTGPAPEAPIAAPAPEPEPWARFNRFAFSLSFGFGSVGLDRLKDLGDAMLVRSGLSGEAPSSGLQINAEVALRYYFPYYIMAQVGYDTVYNKTSSTVSAGPLSGTLYNDTLVMETPILIGGYYTFIGRLYVYGAVGPSVFYFPRSFFDIDPGGAPDFKADPGVGLHVMTGADFLVTEFFAVGLELRYRHLKTGDLKDSEYGQLAHQLFGGDSYNLDFSGISLGLILRFYVI